MTQIKYAIIDNCRKKKGKTYNFLFVTTDKKVFDEYIETKGLN